MRSRSSAAQHDAAVARRLELLTSELASVREPGPGPEPWVLPTTTWSRQPAGPDVAGAEPEPLPGVAVGPVPAPTMARMPGRHALRRRVGGSGAWAELLPEGLRGRIGLGPGQVAVVAVLAAAGLALTCWWLLRSGGHVVAAPGSLRPPGPSAASGPAGAGALETPQAVSAAPPGMTAAGAASSSSARAKVVVDVTGKVRHPGIVVLRSGARVVDAVRAAGGARRSVDLGALNLARVVNDGEQIVVGSVAAGAATGPGPSAATGVPATGLVNLNTADETTLESLPEVGPVTAQAILAWRTAHGGFTSVDQLLDVEGIGDATLAKLQPYVTV